MSYSNNKRFLGRAGDWKALSPSVGHTHPLSQDSCHHRCVRPTRAGGAEGRGVDGDPCPSLNAGSADSGLGLAQPSWPNPPGLFPHRTSRRRVRATSRQTCHAGSLPRGSTLEDSQPLTWALSTCPLTMSRKTLGPAAAIAGPRGC